MNYLIKNIEKKLKKSLSKNTFLQQSDSSIQLNALKSNPISFLTSNNKVISFTIKNFLYNFLLFFSKNFINKKKNIENFMAFLKFYEYFNSFFFNNKIFFFKKYALKKKKDPLYLKNFFLYNRQIYSDYGFKRLRDKRIDFYKKNI